MKNVWFLVMSVRTKKSFISKAIQFIMFLWNKEKQYHSNFIPNHSACLYFDNGTWKISEMNVLDGHVIKAGYKEMNAVDSDYFKKPHLYDIVYSLYKEPFSFVEYYKMVQYFQKLKKRHEEYNYLGIGDEILEVLSDGKVNIQKTGDKRLFCSAMVANGLNKIHDLIVNPSCMNPLDLYNFPSLEPVYTGNIKTLLSKLK